MRGTEKTRDVTDSCIMPYTIDCLRTTESIILDKDQSNNSKKTKRPRTQEDRPSYTHLFAFIYATQVGTCIYPLKSVVSHRARRVVANERGNEGVVASLRPIIMRFTRTILYRVAAHEDNQTNCLCEHTPACFFFVMMHLVCHLPYIHARS